jgi:serine/threonine protein kinase
MQSLAKGVELSAGYRLERFLGRGSLGEVWEATTADDQALAIKFLTCASRLHAAAEIRALQSIRQLEHPNLIRVHRIWGDAGFVAVAMELAEGSLLDLLDVYYAECDGPMPAIHLCHFLAQAASGIDFLNARQHLVDGQRVAVRHCDIKPSNLLVTDGRVKVADFSLSVQTTATMGFNKRVGTLDYAAPEVFQGQLSDRTDQYALAVSYCQLRGGRLPFPKTPANFSTTYVRPEPDLTMLSAAEQPVLARALDPVPQNRFPNCGAMMCAMARVVSRTA